MISNRFLHVEILLLEKYMTTHRNNAHAYSCLAGDRQDGTPPADLFSVAADPLQRICHRGSIPFGLTDFANPVIHKKYTTF
jgi:hypothetical protein